MTDSRERDFLYPYNVPHLSLFPEDRSQMGTFWAEFDQSHRQEGGNSRGSSSDTNEWPR